MYQPLEMDLWCQDLLSIIIIIIIILNMCSGADVDVKLSYEAGGGE